MCGWILCIFFFLLEGRRTSGWSSAPFTFLPIFLLAQILMRADLGDEPEHPLEVVISNPPGQDATRTPQLTGNVGQRSLHSARISEETRTADTATLCQTQKVSLTETRTRVLANGGQAPNQLHHRGSHPVVAVRCLWLRRSARLAGRCTRSARLAGRCTLWCSFWLDSLDVSSSFLSLVLPSA